MGRAQALVYVDAPDRIADARFIQSEIFDIGRATDRDEDRIATDRRGLVVD